MNPDPGSLSNLRDLVAPPPVSWWPPAPGWWCLAAALLATIAALARLCVRHRRASAYRREAVKAVRTATSTAAIAGILKRTALTTFSRPNVARLSGDAWCDWLSQTSAVTVTPAVRTALSTAVFHDSAQTVPRELRRFAEDWIRQHKLPDHTGEADA